LLCLPTTPPPRAPLLPYTTLFRSVRLVGLGVPAGYVAGVRMRAPGRRLLRPGVPRGGPPLSFRQRHAIRRVSLHRAVPDAPELGGLEDQWRGRQLLILCEASSHDTGLLRKYDSFAMWHASAAW